MDQFHDFFIQPSNRRINLKDVVKNIFLYVYIKWFQKSQKKNGKNVVLQQ